MRVVVIDDDDKIRANIKMLLSMYVPSTEVIAEASGVHEGLACLAEHKPDLLLLDVEMKDGTGFDLLSLYGKLDFQVVFVTGHDGYAIKAFKYNAIDYILKPIDPDDLVAALKKVSATKIPSEEKATTKQHLGKEQNILLRDAETVYLVKINDIIRCQSEVNYTTFHLVDGRQITVSKTLKAYDLLFDDQFFFRLHQSHLINLLHFDRYDKKDGGVVYMKDGSPIPVAVRRKEAMMQALTNI